MPNAVVTPRPVPRGTCEHARVRAETDPAPPALLRVSCTRCGHRWIQIQAQTPVRHEGAPSSAGQPGR